MHLFSTKSEKRRGTCLYTYIVLNSDTWGRNEGAADSWRSYSVPNIRQVYLTTSENKKHERQAKVGEKYEVEVANDINYVLDMYRNMVMEKKAHDWQTTLSGILRVHVHGATDEATVAIAREVIFDFLCCLFWHQPKQELYKQC